MHNLRHDTLPSCITGLKCFISSRRCYGDVAEGANPTRLLGFDPELLHADLDVSGLERV